MANPSQDSPLGYAGQIEALMKMPQSLCNQCGWSCRMVTSKGGLNFSELQALANSGNSDDAQQAQTFLNLFEPYPSQAEAQALAPEFVRRVREVAERQDKSPDDITFFKCRYLRSDNRCGVYEDRPEGCRQYPIAHPNTIFHPGCGFEQQSRQNWAQIERILAILGLNDKGRPLEKPSASPIAGHADADSKID